MYGSDATVENLTWSTDCWLNIYENSLRDKVREGLVGVSNEYGHIQFLLPYTIVLLHVTYKFYSLTTMLYEK